MPSCCGGGTGQVQQQGVRIAETLGTLPSVGACSTCVGGRLTDSQNEHESHSELSSGRAAGSVRCLQHVVDKHQPEENAEDDHCVQQSILVERVPWHTDYVHRHRATKQVRVVPRKTAIDSLRTIWLCLIGSFET